MVGVNANTGDTFVSFFLDVNLAVGIGPTGDFFSFFLSVGVNANAVALEWSLFLGSVGDANAVGVNANAVVTVGIGPTADFFFFFFFFLCGAAVDRSTTAC